MEPIASSGASAVLRPASGALPSDLSALLRDGRVLAAEVLASPGDGTVLLALGRHSVPAETHLRLDPGASFLARVEESASGVVLHVLEAGGAQESELLRALRAVVGEQRPIGELLGELGRALRAQLAASAALPATLRELAAGLELHHVARPEAGGAALQALLLRTGLGREAALAAALGGALSREAVERLRTDLKALLLRAQAGLEEGPLRQAVARALAGLEAEQLLNLARERAGEPLVLSFPVSDSQGWATARLLVPARREREEDGAGEEAGASRITLGVDLSRLGPVRADLVLGPRSLSVRVLVTREDLARRIEADLRALRGRLGDGQRAVEVRVRLGTREEAALGERPLDIRFLRENRLLSLTG